MQGRLGAAQIDHADAHDAERGSGAQRHQIAQQRQRQRRRRDGDHDAQERGARGRRLELGVHRAEHARHQAIAAHLIEHARLGIDQGQHHRRQAHHRPDLDQEAEQVDLSVRGKRPRHQRPGRVHGVDRLGDGRTAREVRILDHPGQHRCHHHVDGGADEQRAQNADRQVLGRVLGFSGGGRDRFETHIGKEDDGRGIEHPEHPEAVPRAALLGRDVRRDQRGPVVGIHIGKADTDEDQQHRHLQDHRKVGEAGGFTHADHQKGRHGQHAQRRHQVQLRAQARLEADRAVGLGNLGHHDRGGPHRLGDVDAEIHQEGMHVFRPARRHGRGGDPVLEQQQPPHRPGEHLAQAAIGIGVGRARHRHGRGQLGIAQARNGADNAGQHEGQHHAGTGILGRRIAGHDKDARPDDRPDAEADQVDRTQVPAQFTALGIGLDQRDWLLQKQSVGHRVSPPAPAGALVRAPCGTSARARTRVREVDAIAASGSTQSRDAIPPDFSAPCPPSAHHGGRHRRRRHHGSGRRLAPLIGLDQRAIGRHPGEPLALHVLADLEVQVDGGGRAAERVREEAQALAAGDGVADRHLQQRRIHVQIAIDARPRAQVDREPPDIGDHPVIHRQHRNAVMVGGWLAPHGAAQCGVSGADVHALVDLARDTVEASAVGRTELAEGVAPGEREIGRGALVAAHRPTAGIVHLRVQPGRDRRCHREHDAGRIDGVVQHARPRPRFEVAGCVIGEARRRRR